MVKLFVIIGLIAAVAAADTAIKFEDADGSACIIRKDGEKLSFINDGNPSSNVHCDIGVNGANGGHRVGSALDALYDRVGSLEQAVSALQVAPPPSLSSMIKLDGWACGGGDSILQAMADTNCPGFKNKDMTELEAVTKCNECADCHGIFASKADLSNWYYCGKKDSNGLSTTYASRGVWSDYKAYFKADPYDQSDLCFTGTSYSPMTWQRDNCSPTSTTTNAALLAGKPPNNMVKLRGFACGGGGGPLQAQADSHCPGFQNTMSEQAATDKCNDCDDCHGIFSSDGSSEWHYCGKSHGDYAARGVWDNYDAYFKYDASDTNDYCMHGQSWTPPAERLHECSPYTTTSPTCKAGATMTAKLDGYACGGGGTQLQAQANHYCPGYSNTMSESAAVEMCRSCTDCHGIFSGKGSSDWHYCGKSHGTYAARGLWSNYDAYFKEDTCDDANYCLSGQSWSLSGQDCVPSTTVGLPAPTASPTPAPPPPPARHSCMMGRHHYCQACVDAGNDNSLCDAPWGIGNCALNACVDW